MPDTPANPVETLAERRREATRWRLAAEWALPPDRVTGETDDEMRAAIAATTRSAFLLPGMPTRSASLN